METGYTWDEAKRHANLRKHGLDFAHADWVLANRFRLDIDSPRGRDHRVQSFAYVAERLAVLTVVHQFGQPPRIISFRPASREEREAYHDWLENEFNDS